MTLVFPVLLAATLAAPADQPASSRPDLVQAPALAASQVHPFWDWQNLALFSGVAATRAFDYFSTAKFREKNLREWLLDDKTVDNRPLFATIEVAGTLLSVGASYLFHRTGYHRLERWTSIVHIGLASAGGIWNYSLPNGL